MNKNSLERLKTNNSCFSRFRNYLKKVNIEN